MLNLLKALFTEEQASLVGDFPLGAYTATALAQKLDRNEDKLKKMLTQMSADGLIFEARAENGEPEYSVLAFEPGLIELQYLKGNDDERTGKVLLRVYVPESPQGVYLHIHGGGFMLGRAHQSDEPCFRLANSCL